MTNTFAILRVFLVAFSFLICAGSERVAFSATVEQASELALVRSVVDGDTIDVAGIGRVRLLGIDAPELGRPPETPAPFAQQAREKLASLVSHRWVRLQYDGERSDAYNRRLAYVVLETGVFVNAALVREGLARVSTRGRLSRIEELTRAEADARAWRRGMWGSGSPRSSERYVVPLRPKRPGEASGTR
jgi:micrococcal nuclease